MSVYLWSGISVHFATEFSIVALSRVDNRLLDLNLRHVWNGILKVNNLQF
jgi:hypothetical protein